ncbi:MAG: hypothetical protein QF408_13300 [Pirellulales bacterium]|jgi:hypothetical protein|nr:hypothetical protein [Pirellulales bacterium]
MIEKQWSKNFKRDLPKNREKPLNNRKKAKYPFLGEHIVCGKSILYACEEALGGDEKWTDSPAGDFSCQFKYGSIKFYWTRS